MKLHVHVVITVSPVAIKVPVILPISLSDQLAQASVYVSPISRVTKLEPLKVITGISVSAHEVAPVPLSYPAGHVVHEIFHVVLLNVHAGQASSCVDSVFATKYHVCAHVHVQPAVALNDHASQTLQLTTHPVAVANSLHGLQVGVVIVIFLKTSSASFPAVSA